MALSRYLSLSSASSSFPTCLRIPVHGTSVPKRKLSQSNECSLRVGRADNRTLAPSLRRCVESIPVREVFTADIADLHLVAHLRAYLAIRHFQQRRFRSCTGLCAVSQAEPESKIRSMADQRIPYDNIRRSCSNDTGVCMVLRYDSPRLALATDDLRCGHEHHHLCVARGLGYSRWLEMGLLYPRGVRLRALWSLLRLGS